MQESTRAQVQIINVSKRYGEHNVQALRNVSLNLERGQFVALMGPSGCGKSTLLNCIAGIDKPDRGEILVDNADITKLDENALTLLRREKIGFVFQFFNLLSTLTVRENIELPLDLAGGVRATAVSKSTALLSEIGLLERANFYPSQLSGGEMQRVSVLRAIIHGPEIVLADEPTGNLDTVSGNQILSILQSLCHDKGETVLMATHSQEAASFADVIIRMKDGAIETVA
jgi:putative ABC transport system ATP-binding protein